MFKRIAKIISENLDIDEDMITMETDMVRDLAINSIDIVNLICVLEDEFKIEIPDRHIKDFMRVRDIVEYVDSHSTESATA